VWGGGFGKVSFALWIFHLEHLEKSVGDKLIANCLLQKKKKKKKKKKEILGLWVRLKKSIF
jgi:hypothetical protein